MINDMLEALVTRTQTLLPKLKTCEVHPGRFDARELQRIAARTPAVYFAALETQRSQTQEDRTERTQVQIGAFVVTQDARRLPRHVSAVNLVEALCGHLPQFKLGIEGVRKPKAPRARNLYGGNIDKKGVALWAVTFTVEATLGNPVNDNIDDQGALITDLYLGQAPEIGAGYEDDYHHVEVTP